MSVRKIINCDLCGKIEFLSDYGLNHAHQIRSLLKKGGWKVDKRGGLDYCLFCSSDVELEEKDYPTLPKWSRFAVSGDPVTPAQAEEIIVRTDSLFFCSNYKEKENEFYEALGMKLIENGYPCTDSFKKVKEELKSLDLDFLGNSRIISAYIKGPHGWCDWNGKIFTNSYNLGKHPSVAAIRSDWIKIAEAFPFLNLRCQVFNGEYCEDDVKPAVEFIVSKGKVKTMKPKEALVLNSDTTGLSLMQNLLNVDRELGVNLSKFRNIIKRLKT